ncbi:hypothetical protein B0T16DRAFT_422484 [Cercophora newfieldiana]|uniref:Uncharacterized protein n=1 Tax=Cercophora newfieldiana TaxID=92897 RepID=A0AA39XU34_9PEZI|nr:hypothetical protein B0T16DRAFT_422484 [Cercophora newfieldiana]
MVSEPEVAAISALHGLDRHDPHELQVNDSFVVCDAGGDTVDLISYTITNLKPLLEVQEATAGTGAFCGSSFLDDPYRIEKNPFVLVSFNTTYLQVESKPGMYKCLLRYPGQSREVLHDRFARV